jgi:hypothetical protein
LIPFPDLQVGTREELLDWSFQHGFGINGRASIDDYFNPYLRKDPVTGELFTEPTPELVSAAEKLYQDYGGVDAAVLQYEDNPLNWDKNPFMDLDSEEQAQTAISSSSNLGRPQMGLFLDAIESDQNLDWNYEPAWLEAKMRLNSLSSQST